MGLQPHYIAKKEMIEINEQTTTKVEYPKFWVIYEDASDIRKAKPFSTIEGAERWIKSTGNKVIAVTQSCKLSEGSGIMDKYKKLELDLREAYQEALKAKTGDDGGSANLDATFLILPRWREEKVLMAIEGAGLYCLGKTEWIGKGYMISTGGGQGNDRVRVRDKFKAILAGKGYKVIGFDKID